MVGIAASSESEGWMMDRRKEGCRGGGHLEKRKKGNNKYKYNISLDGEQRAECKLRAKARMEEWWYIKKTRREGEEEKNDVGRNLEI